jgi:carbonic anhydrase/acetyltransferase-like protein (isoleucine patch superfamily)
MLYHFDGHEPTVGRDTYVAESALVIGDVAIGDNCYIGHGAILRGDYGRITIGRGTAVEEGVVVHAPPQDLCSIGQLVTIGHGAIIHSKLIGDHVAIGMGAILSIRTEIGAHAIVAEGAVVKREQKVAARVVVAGNPAKVVRDVSDKDVEHWAWANQLYIDLAKKYLTLGMYPVDMSNPL